MVAPDPASKRKRVGREDGTSDDEGGDEEGQIHDDVDYDEALVSAVPGGRHWAPASFFERLAYKALFNEGMAVLPPLQGFSLRYHKANRQWHGCSPYSAKDIEPSWGPTVRSERKALLMVLEVSVLTFTAICVCDFYVSFGI